MIGKNNPMNIRYSSFNNWQGQIGQTKGFCDFKHVDYCIRAAFKIFMSYRRRGIKSYREIVYCYAPPSENKSESYLRYVCEKLGVVSSEIPSSLFQFARLIRVMSYYEGNPLSYTSIEVLNVLEKFGLK